MDKEERILGETQLTINQLKSYAHEVAGSWNGDLPGVAEDRAHIANDIIEKCSELSELLTELGDT